VVLGVAVMQGMSGDLSLVNSAPAVAAAGLPVMIGAEPLTLTLSPVIASQLVQMFGPACTGIILFGLRMT